MKAAISIALFAGVGLVQGCALIGPASLGSGRPAYNEIINATEDQQLLNYIVRERYDETAGMLRVASVTANIRVNGSVGSDIGFGPRRDFDGNLVPLSLGAGFEESPTITYVPVRSEQYIRQMLAPVTLEQALLLSRADTGYIQPLRLVIRRINGIGNPLFVETADDDRFDRFLHLFEKLRDGGQLDVFHSDAGAYYLALHLNDPSEMARAMCELLGVKVKPADKGAATMIPIRAATGATDGLGLNIETTSAFEIVRLAAQRIEAPKPHLESGLAGTIEDAVASSASRRVTTDEVPEIIRIRSSKARPQNAVVAVRHRGWWFYIDATDAWSKRTYMLVRTIIGMRLDNADAAQATPLLTLPVGG